MCPAIHFWAVFPCCHCPQVSFSTILSVPSQLQISYLHTLTSWGRMMVFSVMHLGEVRGKEKGGRKEVKEGRGRGQRESRVQVCTSVLSPEIPAKVSFCHADQDEKMRMTYIANDGGGGSLTRLATVQSHSLLNLPLSKSHLTSLQIILADTKYPMPLPQQEQGGGQGNSSSTSFTGQSRGYAGFLLCCSWTAARGLGVQLGPSQSLYLCPCTTPSLNCHLSSSTSKAQLSPGFGSPKTLSDFLGPTQPCAFPPSLGEPDGSCFNNRIGLKPRARLSPLTKFEVRLGLLL